jgi:L-cysteine desulfidase
MSLEAQLLKIIEEQQLQLKQQQQEQQKALELIQAQSMTIEELKSFTQTLNEKHSEAVKIVQKYQQITQKLSAQTISADFSQAIQENLKTQLQTRLSDLVQNLQIENQAKAILANSLPRLAQSEIEQQLKPMTDQIIKRMTSVSSINKN